VVAVRKPTEPDITNADAMVASRRADSARRRKRVLEAVESFAPHLGEISISDIARVAGVHRTFIYRHQDLLDHVRSRERDAGYESC
jgi:hypothetical protein